MTNDPRGPHDDDLDERLDELEDKLGRLRDELGDDTGSSSRLPSPSEFIQFTEQYTIPTVIALLETAIRSLELLRGLLRLADPNRRVTDDIGDQLTGRTDGRLAEARSEASRGLARSLSELRTALSKADLPQDEASKSIIEEARELSAEIERRVEQAEDRTDSSRSPGSRQSSNSSDPSLESSNGTGSRTDRGPNTGGDAVTIDVEDADGHENDDDSAESDNSDAGTEQPPEGDGGQETLANDPFDSPDEIGIDVDSELRSIKNELDDIEDQQANRDNGTGENTSDGDEDESHSDDGDMSNTDDFDSGDDTDDDGDSRSK